MTEQTSKPTAISAPLVVTNERLEEIAKKYDQVATGGLFAGIGLFLAFVVYGLISYYTGRAMPRMFVLAVWMAVTWSASALARAFYSRELTPGERLRVTIVMLGGLMGLGIATYGLALPFTTYSDVFSGGFKEWRKNPGALLWTGIPLFGGLILSFVSLLLTSGLQRTSATARRLLYGYNAVLSGVLLLFIFLLLNVLPYSGVWPFKALAQTSDWTSTRTYSLSEATKDRLAALDKPVKVYVILSQHDPLNDEVDILKESTREITNRVTWEYLSPELNSSAVDALVAKYPITSTGLLVVYGAEGSESNQFIPKKDLFAIDSMSEAGRVTFKGESALAKALTYLSEGKTKPVIYFTQDHGELSLSEARERPDDELAGAMQKRSRETMAEVSRRLSLSNYEVKPLKFDIGKPKVPEDADIVVVARPTTPFSPAEVSALRSFQAGNEKKKGKLFFLLNVVRSGDKMAQSGLESILAENGVQAGDERIIAIEPRRLGLMVLG
jgi:hypothetical protein